jgi:hypothetical protein
MFRLSNEEKKVLMAKGRDPLALEKSQRFIRLPEAESKVVEIIPIQSRKSNWV